MEELNDKCCSDCHQQFLEYSWKSPLLCKNCYQRRYNRINKERLYGYHQSYREGHREEARQRTAKYREQFPDKVKTAKQLDYDKNKEKISLRRRTTPRGRFQTYKNSARCTKKDFLITFEEFMTFWQKPCTYCGCKIDTIGLDRIHCDQGYLIDNITPCCFVCNRGRNNLDQKVFIAYLDQLASFRTNLPKENK